MQLYSTHPRYNSRSVTPHHTCFISSSNHLHSHNHTVPIYGHSYHLKPSSRAPLMFSSFISHLAHQIPSIMMIPAPPDFPLFHSLFVAYHVYPSLTSIYSFSSKTSLNYDLIIGPSCLSCTTSSKLWRAPIFTKLPLHTPHLNYMLTIYLLP